MNILKKVTALIMAAVMSVLSMTAVSFADEGSIGEYNSADGYYHITTAAQIANIASRSQTAGDPVLTSKFVLDNDIDMTGITEYSIGGNDSPFLGTFDGQGHKITGLKYENDLSTFTFTSLFGVVGSSSAANNAVIKNIVIDGADIRSYSRGGILITDAVNAEISNISIQNGYLRVRPGGTGVELITGAGVKLGAIAATAQNIKMYNCESVNTNINVNSTTGLQAASGDVFYEGGLVGLINGNSEIEYSRVIGGSVKDYISFAVIALSGQVMYSGGIVGVASDNVKISDSYCTAYVLPQSLMAVGVAAGVDAYAGGIVGCINSEGVSVERCHYDGLIENVSYAGTLLVAVPVNNNHLGGIVGRLSENGKVENCFYNYTNAVGTKSRPDISAIEDTDDSAGVYQGYEESAYSTESNFIGFDFNGTQVRESGNIDQWTMGVQSATVTASSQTSAKTPSDTEAKSLSMPVHDVSVNIYSNLNNSSLNIASSNLSGTQPKFVLPDENSVAELREGAEKGSTTFVGYALVSDCENEPVLDGLYKEGDEIDAELAREYNSDTKRIYAVWAQVETVKGAQVRVDDTVESLRVMTCVNKSDLERAGMTADSQYVRGVLFLNNESAAESDMVITNENIQTISVEPNANTWYGNSYYTDTLIEGQGVYSTVANMDSSEYEKLYSTRWAFRGYLIFTYSDGSERVVYGDFDREGNIRSIQDVAAAYVNEAESIGTSIDAEAQGILNEYTK